MKSKIFITTTMLAIGIAGLAHAANNEIAITMKNGGFEPANINVPANAKIHLTVTNKEDHETEFESYELNQEQKIKSGQTIDMFVGPLSSGTYPIFDDKNPDAKGVVVVK